MGEQVTAQAHLTIVNTINSYTHVRYGTNSSGAGMTAMPTTSTTYIGIYTGTSSTAPTTASSYTWSKYVGEKGAKGDKGDKGDQGNQGATGPEATVTIVPNNINWDNNTATLNTVVRVNGIVQTPPNPNTWNYVWTKTKGLSTTSLTSGTGSSYSSFTLDGTTNALDSTYNCTVTW